MNFNQQENFSSFLLFLAHVKQSYTLCMFCVCFSVSTHTKNNKKKGEEKTIINGDMAINLIIYR